MASVALVMIDGARLVEQLARGATGPTSIGAAESATRGRPRLADGLDPIDGVLALLLDPVGQARRRALSADRGPR